MFLLDLLIAVLISDLLQILHSLDGFLRKFTYIHKLSSSLESALESSCSTLRITSYHILLAESRGEC